MNPWIRLHSGKKFHILNPRAEEFDINDAAHALSHLCRFAGHTKYFYSISQHSCIVCDLLPDELKLEGLLHDFAEYALNDISTQLKSVLPQYKEIEIRAEKVLAKKYKLKFPFPSAIKEADMVALVSEMKSLMPSGDYKNIPFTPMTKKIVPWSIEKSKREFLKRFRKYKRN